MTKDDIRRTPRLFASLLMAILPIYTTSVTAAPLSAVDAPALPAQAKVARFDIDAKDVQALFVDMQSELTGDSASTFPRVLAGTFSDPALVRNLTKQHRKVLVVSGYATEVAVLQTVLSAVKAGFTVYIPVDAMGSRSSRTESAALREMEMAGAIPTSVLALAAQLAPDFSKPPGIDILGTFKDLRPPQ